ncbi:MAG: polysaccharide pyruvyl transferase family protein [Muribaculaceae bacterium]|nr:polysaccharide pyruvyl transferase family protein [Muribaculaceae bacterium]
MCQVAIITCHDVYNFGASLQAYALASFISDAGHDVKVIDYKPDYITRPFRFDAVKKAGWDYPLLRQLHVLVTLPQRLLFRQHKVLSDQFIHTYLPLTSTTYHSLDQLREASLDAQLLITGSCQIWNPRYDMGCDPAFYLHFGPESARRISYAPSFTSAILPQGSEAKLKKLISRLDRVTVREVSGLKNLQQMGIEGSHVCDPVFLRSEQSWRDLASKAQLPSWLPSKYVLLYDVEGSPLLHNRAHDDAAEMHRPIVKIEGCTMRCGWHIAPCGPIEFLALMLGTKDVWSNSYHALAFSKLFGRSMNLVMRADISNMRLLDLCGQKASVLQDHIDDSANFLLSELSGVMKIVS